MKVDFTYIKQNCKMGKLYTGVEMCQENSTSAYTGVNNR